jgi:hypothetical protein
VQRGGELRLGTKPAQERSVVGQRRVQHFDRDSTTKTLVVGYVDATAGTGTDGAMQQIAAREHPAREVAANTSRHSEHGSGRGARIRVIALCCVRDLQNSGDTVPAWRFADLSIPNASPSSQSSCSSW